MAKGDFVQSALQNANPITGPLNAISGFASGGPSSSGDISGGTLDFGQFTTQGISRGGIPTQTNQLLVIGGAIAAVVVLATILRR